MLNPSKNMFNPFMNPSTSEINLFDLFYRALAWWGRGKCAGWDCWGCERPLLAEMNGPTGLRIKLGSNLFNPLKNLFNPLKNFSHPK